MNARDLWVTAPDGLTLYARDHGPLTGDALPVVCLPGLTRDGSDFHDLALALAGERRVLALDYRGRGRSGHDPDPARYDLKVELADVLQVLVVAGIEEAVVVGTSRGGFLAMGLAAARPALLRGVVLNDIGPVIEPAGLARIKGYVGQLGAPRDHTEAAELLRARFGDHFPALTPQQWRGWAERTWVGEAGGLRLAYDPALQRTLDAFDPAQPVPAMWGLFAGLGAVPVLALRGEHSDLLSAGTLAAMAAAHPALEAVTVPGQGHAPLVEGEVVGTIADFVARVEAGQRARRPGQPAAQPTR